MKPRIAITPGDPSGIGPEIIVKSLENIRSFCTPVLFGTRELFDKAAEVSGISINYKDFELEDIKIKFRYSPGELCAENGRYAGEAIRKAVKSCLDKNTEAIVTAPINKEAFKLADINFPGHTEFLGHLSGVDETMMLFYSEAFSVILHTIHIPLHDAIHEVTEDKLIHRISFASEKLEMLTGKKVATAVCGLNPHAGENGKIGTEDFQIKNAVRFLKDKGLNIEGPFPADTLFHKVISEKNYNLVYAMNHDQGLIPIKTLFPDTSINITLGLPFIRTSVNHGTAFDIAWKGKSNNMNFIEAVKTASRFLQEG